MNEDLIKLLDELSFLSRETVGASFVIQHNKDNGTWKVVFSNAMVYSKERAKETDFKQALVDAIGWLKERRVPINKPEERFTLFNR